MSTLAMKFCKFPFSDSAGKYSVVFVAKLLTVRLKASGSPGGDVVVERFNPCTSISIRSSPLAHAPLLRALKVRLPKATSA